MTQEWIQSGNNYILAQVNSLAKPSKTGILLFPGLMQPCSNLCYLNRDILMEMENNSIFSASIDPIGHGESYGNYINISLKSLYQNIIDSVNFAKKQCIKNLYLFGQGIISNLLSKYAESDDFIKGVFLLNPVIMDKNTEEELANYLNEFTGEHEIELNRAVLTRFMNFFYMSGVEMSNIEFEKLDKEFIFQIYFERSLFSEKFIDKHKNIILFTNEEKLHYEGITEKYRIQCTLKTYNDRMEIIKNIVDSLQQKGM